MTSLKKVIKSQKHPTDRDNNFKIPFTNKGRGIITCILLRSVFLKNYHQLDYTPYIRDTVCVWETRKQTL